METAKRAAVGASVVYHLEPEIFRWGGYDKRSIARWTLLVDRNSTDDWSRQMGQTLLLLAASDCCLIRGCLINV